MLLLRMLLYPFPRVDEGLYPWSDIIAATVCRIIGVLPREDGTLWVWHHGEMTTIG